MVTPGEAVWEAKQALRALGRIEITGEIVLDHDAMVLVERSSDGGVGARVMLKASRSQIDEYEALVLAGRMTGRDATVFRVTGDWGWLPRWGSPVLHVHTIHTGDHQPPAVPVPVVLVSVQHDHPVPTMIKRVAVVVPSGSASQSDIRAQLDGTSIEVVWHHPKFDQPAEIAAVLATIRDVDLIVIARGGGAATDLDALNQRVVCEVVAAHRVPIWTGIGHALNTTETDRYAQRSFPTPTAVAAAFAVG